MAERPRTPPPLTRPEGGEDRASEFASLRKENESPQLKAALGTTSWAMLDACLEGALIHQGGVIRYVNPALAGLLGYASVKGLLGQHFWEVIPRPEDVPALQERTAKVMQGEGATLSPVWHGQRVGGGSVALQSVGYRIEWEGGPAILSLHLEATDRARAEEAVAASERRFRKLIENSHDAFTLLGPEGTLIYQSAAGYRALGGEPGSNLGVSALGCIHADDALMARRLLDAVMLRPEEPVSGARLRARHANGSYRWLELHASNLIADPDVRGILVNWRDVTDQLAAEHSLRDHIAFTDTLIRTAGEGICVCYAIDPPPHVAFSVWNERMTELTGYTMEEINRLGWHQTMYPDPQERARAVDRMARMHQGDDLRQEEWVITRKDGQRRALAISTSRVARETGPAVVALMSDVTEHRKAASALREGAERLRLALDSAGMASYVIQLPGGELSGSEGLATFLRLGPENKGRPLHYLAPVHPDDRERVREEVERVSANRGELRVEFRGATPADGGGEAWYTTRARFVPADESHAARLYGVTVDVTARKRADELRRQLEERVRRSQHLESLAALAGGIAHDFNNLLTTMLGYASLSRDMLLDRSTIHDYLGHIELAARRAADLCQQMLAYSGGMPYRPGPLDLNVTVLEAIRLTEPTLPVRANLMTRLVHDLPSVRGDGAQLRQAIVNLLINAVEALGEEGGLIEVTTGVGTLTRERLLGTPHAEHLAPGLYVCLEVSDTGSGMDAATQTRVFEPFFTTKFLGRGLGLSAVLGIIRGHGGAIAVQSRPGEGTSVQLFFLPAPHPSPDQ